MPLTLWVTGILLAGLAAGAGPALASYAIPPIMPVYGVTTDSRGVTVRVAPNGCNALKSDFTIALNKSDQRPMLLIARKSAARSLVACASPVPTDVAVTFSYDDLGLKPGQPFSLANPLVMAPGGT